MVKTVTSINGRTVPKKEARISVLDNSVLYAEGLFETFLAIGDHPIFESGHLRRLHAGADRVGLKLPVSDDRLRRWMCLTLRKHPARLKKLRLTLTSGESARWLGRSGRPQVILTAAPHRLPERPFKLLVSEWRVDHRSAFRQVKTLSYAINAAALRQAQAQGCDDALLLNQRGEVAEVTSANVFWVEGDRVYTPPLNAGCLGGVTRQVLLSEAHKLGIKIVERRCPLPRLLDADEVFISSSLKLDVAVALLVEGSHRYRLHQGPIADRFNRHLHQMLGIA